MEPLILFDSKKCIGCHSCEIACQLENDAPPGLLLRKVRTHSAGVYPAVRPLSISTACFHCSDPSCVSACPAGALHKKTNGVVEHIRSKCMGCGYCIQTCPFRVPKYSPTQSTMRKCSFCSLRIDSGEMPACVSKCSTGALAYYSEWIGGAGNPSSYGKKEHLQMLYNLEGKPTDYSLPEPVPPNTVTSNQIWKWLIGLIPGGIILGWLWKKSEDEEEEEEYA